MPGRAETRQDKLCVTTFLCSLIYMRYEFSFNTF